MKKHINMKNILTCITGCLFSIVLVCLIAFTNSYTNAAPSTIEYDLLVLASKVSNWLLLLYVFVPSVTDNNTSFLASAIILLLITETVTEESLVTLYLFVSSSNSTYWPLI